MRRSIRKPLAALVLTAVAMVPPLAATRAADQSAGAYVSAVDLDIVPSQMEQFMAAIKEDAAATLQEPGCQEFDIMVQADNPSHIFLLEVYEDQAAFQAHRASEHYKKYKAATAATVANRQTRTMTAVALHAKAH